ncbi:uncharacterized protein J3D65DRAFT_660345 [Phyllosticta citribraziliensis]|uniref:Ribonucleases P/MRP subunit Pop8-like domain-containing protein n=1 Tax=Phyllosticta citribraziliensis TaxID=989973 RepID=A0ABR1LGX5_9PEZI
MPSTLPLSQPPAKTTTTTTTPATATATTRTQHTYTPSPHLYIHLTYHAPQTASASTSSTAVVDPITLRQALTAALRQHHGHHGAAIPLDILYVGASAPCTSSTSSSSSSSAAPSPATATHIITHTIIRAPLADGAAVVGACGAWVGETAGGSGGRMAALGARGEEEAAARSRWVVRGWDGALARLVHGDGNELFG